MTSITVYPFVRCLLSKHEKVTSKLKLGSIRKYRFFTVEYGYRDNLC